MSSLLKDIVQMNLHRPFIDRQFAREAPDIARRRSGVSTSDFSRLRRIRTDRIDLATSDVDPGPHAETRFLSIPFASA